MSNKSPSQPHPAEQDETRYCEIGKHRAQKTLRCRTCLRYFCNYHVNHNCTKVTFGQAVRSFFRAIGHRLVTKPLMRLAQRIEGENDHVKKESE